MADQFDRWNAALAGAKLDMGAKGNPPSGYFRRNAGPKGWEAIAVFRDEDGTLCCIRNIFGDGSNMSAEQIDDMFATEIYAVPYDVYVAVAEEGQPWPAEYTTRLSLKEIKAGVGMTAELGRNKLGLDLKAPVDKTPDNSGLVATEEVQPERMTPLQNAPQIIPQNIPTLGSEGESHAPTDWNRHVDAFRAALLQTTTHDDALACFETHDVDGLPRDNRGRMEMQLDTHRWNITERENPREAIGGNLPPEEMPVEAPADAPPMQAAAPVAEAEPAKELTADEKLKDRIESAAQRVAEWLESIGGMPKTKIEADKVADYATRFGNLHSEAQTAFEAEKRPWLEGGRIVDAKWKFREEATTLRKKYLAVSDKWIDAEKARLAEEAKVAHAAAVESAKREAEATGEPVAKVSAPAVAKVTIGNMRSVSQRSRTTYHATDLSAFVGYLLALENPPQDLIDALNKIANRLGAAGIKAPGIEEDKRSQAA